MNVDRIRQLAEHLRKPKTAEHFDMDYFFAQREGGPPPGTAGDAIRSCGTVACIAGHAVALFDPKSRPESWMAARGAEVLGLIDTDLINALFTPDDILMGNGERAYDATNLQAAAVLDHLAETGEVDWSVAQ